MRVIVIVGLVAILMCLALAGKALLRNPSQVVTETEDEEHALIRRNRHMAKILAWRVGLSVGLFSLIMFSWWMGWIAPVGIPMSR